MKTTICITWLLLGIILCTSAQVTVAKYNLDFEQVTSLHTLPDHWTKWGYYPLSTDTATVHSGKYALRIGAEEGSDQFGCVSYMIPADYTGDSVILHGFMKLEDVHGFAGLFIRVDSDSGVLAFNSMQSLEIQGSRDWAEYRISAALSAGSKTIYVAGIMGGYGRAWFDDFRVHIDDQDLGLETTEAFIPPARLDTTFDSGSGFLLTESNEQELQNLFVLGKVWGFLKYHHPEIARGNLNWDYELFRFLPAIQSLNFEDELNIWIRSFGELNPNGAAQLPESDVKLLPENDWIYNGKLLRTYSADYLRQILASEREKTHYFLEFSPQVGNPSFTNEDHYTTMSWEDTGMKILALFRYWNMVQYFFPNRHLMDQDWDEVLMEFIPRMISTNDELSYKLCCLELIGRIQDTHANIWQFNKHQVLTEFFGTRVAPVKLRFIDEMPVIEKISEQDLPQSRLKHGDIITHINKEEVRDLMLEKIRFCPASNYETQLRNLASRLLRTNQDSLFLNIQNETGNYQVWVPTVDISLIDFRKSDQPSSKILDGNIAYLYPGTMERGSIDMMMDSLNETRAMVIDFRCYPSDFIVFSLSKYLMPEALEFVKFSKGSMEFPGLFTYTPSLKAGETNPDFYKGSVIILVNEQTQSSAEYHSMAFRQAPKASIIGSTTAGADGNISSIVLPGDIWTAISGIGVYYPDGTETQRVGIVPDLVVKPTVVGIREGKDEVLEAALKILSNH